MREIMDNKISIVNHSVKTTDMGLLQFLYPEFIILDKPVLYSDKPIIFTGETKYINQIKTIRSTIHNTFSRGRI